MRRGVLGKDIRLSGKNKEQDAWKLYTATMKILDQGCDVEVKKTKDHIKVSRVTRQTETEMMF